jgi:hypothetical protein
MITVKAKFDGDVFVPEKQPRIPDGQVVYLSISYAPSGREDANPSPSNDPYFDVYAGSRGKNYNPTISARRVRTRRASRETSLT